MSVAEIKSDVFKLFEKVGDAETDRTVLSLMKAMLEQYLSEKKKNTKTLEQQLIENIEFYSFIEERDRLLELAAKLENESLTAEEHEESLRLNQKVERYAFHRLKNVMELAELRGESVETTLKEFAHLTYAHPPKHTLLNE